MGFLGFILLIYLLLCGWVAVAASNKGRSGAAWFFIALILSPVLAGIIVACFAPTPAMIEQQRISSGSLRKCPYCAELVKAEAKICRYCQRDLPEIPPAPAPAEPAWLGPSDIEVPKIPDACLRCGNWNLRSATPEHYVCDTCGSNFHVVGAAAPGPTGIHIATVPTSCPRCSAKGMIALVPGRIYRCDRCCTQYEVVAQAA
jgi:predicted nucleic acid-binding Zn ribbon protein